MAATTTAAIRAARAMPGGVPGLVDATRSARRGAGPEREELPDPTAPAAVERDALDECCERWPSGCSEDDGPSPLPAPARGRGDVLGCALDPGDAPAADAGVDADVGEAPPDGVGAGVGAATVPGDGVGDGVGDAVGATVGAAVGVGVGDGAGSVPAKLSNQLLKVTPSPEVGAPVCMLVTSTLAESPQAFHVHARTEMPCVVAQGRKLSRKGVEPEALSPVSPVTIGYSAASGASTESQHDTVEQPSAV